MSIAVRDKNPNQVSASINAPSTARALSAPLEPNAATARLKSSLPNTRAHEIVAVGQVRAPQPRDGDLRGPHRQRSVASSVSTTPASVPSRASSSQSSATKPAACASAAVEQSRAQHEIERRRRAELRDEYRDAVHRQAVAERPRDRHAEPAERVATRRVADGGDREPAADAVALDGGDGRHPDVLEPVQHARDAPFVGDAVGAVAKVAKAS